jgi:ribosomal protein S18 acetylase RimI-like enzyme
VGHRARQPHRPAPVRLDDQREIDLARVRAGRLTDPAPQFERVAPDDPRALALYRAYVRDEVLVPLGLPADAGALAAEAPPADLAPPTGTLLLVTRAGEPIAIGGVRDLGGPIAEVKSMYVSRSARGDGLGRRLLERLEELAAAAGCRAIRLDTADHLTAAIALYRGLGYREIPAYNDGPAADLWFERPLSEPRRPGP